MSLSLNEQARKILTDNDKGGYTVPTARLYPFQWNWDSVFTGLGFATYDVNRGWEEIETLFSAQWDDGFVPHIVFHKDDPSYYPGASLWSAGNGTLKTSGITQPPVAATVIRRLMETYKSDDSDARAKALMSKVAAWHRWFREVRDPSGEGLVMTVHPWETGRDNNAEWTAPMGNVEVNPSVKLERRDVSMVDASERPHDREYLIYMSLVAEGRALNWDHKAIAEKSSYRVADVGMTMMLLRSERDLLAMAEYFGDEALAAEVSARIKIAEKGVNALWDDELQAYCSKDLLTGKSSGMVTSASMLAPYAGVGSKEQTAALMQHFDRIANKIKYTMPSLDPDHSEYDHKRYWLGPVWLVVNYMVGTGLLEIGEKERGERVHKDTGDLVRDHGFYEAFSCATGQGTGGNHFTWTAAIWLAWAGKELV